MKIAVCISCTHHYQERTRYVESVLSRAGYDCAYITSDFHHISKQRHTVALPHCTQIPTLAYTKNISIRRILSHMLFARDAMKAVEKLKPDLLYVEVPPNSLCRTAARYKRNFPETKLIFDVFDLWPESFPNNRAKQLLQLPFRVWAWFRNSGISKADLVLTECDLFRQKLASFLKDTPAKTLYLCRPEASVCDPKPVAARNGVHLCYLGSVNNIIDIPLITALVQQVQLLQPVTLHIIGDGEARETLISSVEATGATVLYHGKIYDNAQKQAIFDQCSFGLNTLKDSVCIGLTMKSVDYFAGALPIVNTVAGDTWKLVESRNMGINLCRENLAKTARQIVAVSSDEQLAMRRDTLQSFHELFSQPIFTQAFLPLLSFKDGE